MTTTVILTEVEFTLLGVYNTSLPTGTRPGKQWKCMRAGQWWRGEYVDKGDPKTMDIEWCLIQIGDGTAGRYPVSFTKMPEMPVILAEELAAAKARIAELEAVLAHHEIPTVAARPLFTYYLTYDWRKPVSDGLPAGLHDYIVKTTGQDPKTFGDPMGGWRITKPIVHDLDTADGLLALICEMEKDYPGFMLTAWRKIAALKSPLDKPE